LDLATTASDLILPQFRLVKLCGFQTPIYYCMVPICCNSRKFSGNIRGQNISATKNGLYMPKLALLHQRLQEKKRERVLFGES